MSPFDLLRRAFVLSIAVLVCPGCSGAGDGGQGGTSSMTSSSSGVDARGDAASISIGVNTACVVTRQGDVACWGITRSADYPSHPMDVMSNVPVPVGGLPTGIRAVSVSQDHECALTSAGGVLCWGLNDHGQLGDGTIAERHLPVAVAGLPSGAIAISTGDTHSCALTEQGAVWCWGDNASGELGDGTTHESHTPVAVPGLASGVVAISAFVESTCAVTSGGAVRCWGRDDEGQLGDGLTHPSCGVRRCSMVPVAVSGLDAGVTAISGGNSFACVRSKSRGPVCWGTLVHSDVPVAAPGLASEAVAISAGETSACALTSAGAVQCWGKNDNGELGNGTTTASKNAAVTVKGLTSGVVAVAAGPASCAVTHSGGVVCWGFGGWGALGDGKTMHGPPCGEDDCSLEPVEVVGF